MSAMYNFLFDRKSLILLVLGLTLGGGMLFFAGVLVGVYWSLPNGTTLQASAPPRPALLPTREIAPAGAPPPAVPDPGPVAMAPEPPEPAGSAIAQALNEAAGTAAPAGTASSGPLSTEPTIELPAGPAPQENPGPVAEMGESIGLPKTAPPVPRSPLPLAPAPPPLAAVKPHPARQPRPSHREEAGDPQEIQIPSPADTAPAIPATPEIASGEGRYTIQVGAYALVENSEETVAALSRRGYAPYVVEVQGARGVLHVVRVGRFPDRGTAARAASDLRRKARMEAIVQPVSKARNTGETPEGSVGAATGSAPTSG